MTNILIVYYSLTGNTKFIAEILKDELSADILPIKPIKELNPESSIKYFWGGFQRYMKKKPKLEEFDLNPEDYNIIILGTPIWAWKFSPPMYSFISNYDMSNKKVALWVCQSGDGTKAMERFKEELNGAEIIADIKFKDPIRTGKDEAKENAIKFAKEIKDVITR